MSNQRVDIYLADIPFWIGVGPNGKPGTAVKPPIPESRPGVDLVVPTIDDGYPWSLTINLVLNKLNSGQQIDRFYMAGHGSAGQFKLGKPLTWKDASTFAEFQRLRPFCPTWLTNVYIIGCEVAADGECQVQVVEGDRWCMGHFGGSTGSPGYQFLGNLARAINAPAHGSTWSLPLSLKWPEMFKHAPRVTVGPDGAWAYRGAFANEVKRFGSPPPGFAGGTGVSMRS